jgi:hypothetical protein
VQRSALWDVVIPVPTSTDLSNGLVKVWSEQRGVPSTWTTSTGSSLKRREGGKGDR